MKFGHQPIIPPRFVRDVARPSLDLLSLFEGVSSADVADQVGAPYVMSSAIRPLYAPMRTIVGSAVTVKAWPGDNLAVHGALELCGEGDVLVIDWRGHSEACGGGSNMLTGPFTRGFRGVVIDGAWRDSDELKALNRPVFARGTSPFSPPKQRAGEINVPVCCGGVIVEAGDIVVADSDGVAVVPHRHASLVADFLSASQRPDSRKPETGDERAARRASAFFDIFNAQGGVSEPSGA